MALEHHFYMDTAASRHELRGVLIEAGLGFEAELEDWRVPGSAALGSGAFNEATLVSILDDLPPIYRRSRTGVTPTRRIGFRDRKRDPNRFDRDTTQGIVALLRAYPQADAFWEGLGGVLMLVRRHGRLVLSEARTKPHEFWDPEARPFRRLVDLPHVVEPLGPGH